MVCPQIVCLSRRALSDIFLYSSFVVTQVKFALSSSCSTTEQTTASRMWHGISRGLWRMEMSP
jgi:hypothetical protein